MADLWMKVTAQLGVLVAFCGLLEALSELLPVFAAIEALSGEVRHNEVRLAAGGSRCVEVQARLF
jgi:hypothetical protein